MEPEFWHKRWAEKRIAFHEGAPNALMLRHFSAVFDPDPMRVFVPLCGKTVDLHWLLDQGHSVVGIELNRTAVTELFAELGQTPEINALGALERWAAGDIEIFLGDIFDLTADALGAVDAVYDRAALVALPTEMRERYAQHLAAITAAAPQLVITFEYDQSVVSGPPFSVTAAEITALYEQHYALAKLETAAFPRLKNKVDAEETIWALRPV